MKYEEGVKWCGEHMLKVMTENGHKSPVNSGTLFNELMGETTELHTELVQGRVSSKRVVMDVKDCVRAYAMLMDRAVNYDEAVIGEGWCVH